LDNKLRLWPLLFALTLSAALFAQKKPDPNWTLTFAEEFNGAALDLTRWVPHSPWGSVQPPEVLKLSGGQLHIAGRGVISTFGLFAQTYGRFEIRCRTTTSGAKFMLLPIPLGTLPSIQIFETTSNKLSVANRWGTEQTERSFGDSFSAAGLTTGFHTLAVEWESDHISWLLDDKEKFRSVDGIPHQPMYLLLDFTGDVDYIHVYKHPN
jgi:beta-glucanase (GH16 family)